MSTTSATSTEAPAAWSRKNKVGLGLAIFYAVTNIPSVAIPTPDGEEGPPFAILVVCSVLGVVALASAIVGVAWRQPPGRAAGRGQPHRHHADLPAGVLRRRPCGHQAPRGRRRGAHRGHRGPDVLPARAALTAGRHVAEAADASSQPSGGREVRTRSTNLATAGLVARSGHHCSV